LNFEPPGTIFLADSPERYRTLLLSWFEGIRRPLPWRRHRTLYGTWISEMMLQQTTVASVVPYWEKFLDAFPDVEALAAADLEDVLSLWSGLGYYRRARHLHRAAKQVVDLLGGELPGDREGWLQLPGVGPYASGAIASIGLGIPVPALDANARRVLTRWLIEDPKDLEELRPFHLEKIGATLVDEIRPGDWNEALMELGALVCRASAPRCGSCPVRDLCRAHKAGTASRIPVAKAPVPTERVHLGVLVISWKDRVLLLPPGSGPVVVPVGSGVPVRGDLTGLHRGLWGLPSTPWLPGRSGGKSSWRGGIWRQWLDSISGLGPLSESGDPVLLGDFRHAVTRFRLVVQVFGLQLAKGPQSAGDGPFPTFKSQLQDGILIPQGGQDDTQMRGRFCNWGSPEHPVSNLVKKGLLVASKSFV
jgi:A/G-specific adenine glycosylase